MTTTTFDTLKFAKRLEAAGVPSAQAEAFAEAQREALAEAIELGQLATKADLMELKADLVKWMAGLLVAQAAVVAALVKLL
jgi:hypothetical protein